ncbi:putative S-adenosylmethionine carrier 2, chloroplastic [Glycine soja]
MNWVARDGGKIVLKGLYSGLAGNLVGVLPASAIFIGVYEPAKQQLLKSLPENISSVAHFAAGAIGGVASSVVRVPTEVVKQRMQIGQFRSAPDAVRLIVANEGFNGLFAGYGSFLLRDLPFDAIELCIYEQLRIGYKLAGIGPRVLWIGVRGSIFFCVLEKTKQILAQRRHSKAADDDVAMHT